jgi:hypothetical protein
VHGDLRERISGVASSRSPEFEIGREMGLFNGLLV